MIASDRPYSVIHLDATWNAQRFLVQRTIDLLVDKLDDTSFGRINVDEHKDYALSVDLRNVPSCLYFRYGNLVSVVTGMLQDVESNIQILREGGTPDASNELNRM